MMKAEYLEQQSFLQRESAEHEGYAKASRSFNRIWKERDSAQPKLLEAILYKVILSILVYTFFSRMFDLMLPPSVNHSIAVA